MSDTTQKSPFARLDTSLMRSTKSPSQQETSFQENKKTSFQVTQETRKLGNKDAGKQVYKETSKRANYPKVTYQLNPTVTDMLQDTKIVLQRQYHLKASLAEIVEEAIQHVCTDVQENKETSFLASLFTRKQESR